MNRPACVPHHEFAALRGERGVPAAFERLWSAGSLEGLSRPTVAIVGTRAATGYGRKLAHRFAADLGAAGCCIISGLALGIDAAAHQGALDAGAPTIGVLGGGHERFFPRRNRDLAELIVEHGGGVLSPYEPEQPAQPHQFLERNGVVAALSDAVIVIEAPARSGALNTAGWAAGRIPVFAVPGDVDRAHVAGCHALIRDGAILARGPQDIIDDLRLQTLFPGRGAGEAPVHEPADPLQQRIVRLLGEGEQGLDDLVAATQAHAAHVLAALSLMELDGVLEVRAGQRYSLGASMRR